MLPWKDTSPAKAFHTTWCTGDSGMTIANNPKTKASGALQACQLGDRSPQPSQHHASPVIERLHQGDTHLRLSRDG